MFLEEIFSTPIYGFDLELDVDSIRYWCYSVLKENPGRQISNIGGWPVSYTHLTLPTSG